MVELSDYGHVIRRYWPLIVVATLLGTITGFVASGVAPKRYEAHAEVLVSIEGATTLDDINAGSAYLERAMPTFAGIATSQSVIEPAARKLGLAADLAHVMTRVSVVPKDKAFLLDIGASGQDGQSAAALANSVSAELDRVLTSSVSLPKDAKQRFRATQVTVAGVPEAAVAPSRATYVGLGTLGGAALGLTLAIAQARFGFLRWRRPRRVTTGPALRDQG